MCKNFIIGSVQMYLVRKGSLTKPSQITWCPLSFPRVSAWVKLSCTHVTWSLYRPENVRVSAFRFYIPVFTFSFPQVATEHRHSLFDSYRRQEHSVTSELVYWFTDACVTQPARRSWRAISMTHCRKFRWNSGRNTLQYLGLSRHIRRDYEPKL
jgi:hypothetical protein